MALVNNIKQSCDLALTLKELDIILTGLRAGAKAHESVMVVGGSNPFQLLHDDMQKQAIRLFGLVDKK